MMDHNLFNFLALCLSVDVNHEYAKREFGRRQIVFSLIAGKL
ncbi:hypothetical protein NWE55_15735 [Myroides albus]|nr:hypothetical protein [Myroides albus]UVD79554.1 hypothetical protein NWE55_15735 [Myroides albus]